MADIDLERRRGGSAWGWLVGALVVALLAWLGVELMDAGEPELAEVEVTGLHVTREPGGGTMGDADEREMRQPGAEEGKATLAEALSDPQEWMARTVPEATVPVVEVPTDRGFWVTTAGGRLFVVLIDQPREEPRDIDSGAMVRLTGGTFRNAQNLTELEGEPLDEQTRRTARNEGIFLLVDERNVEIVDRVGGSM